MKGEYLINAQGEDVVAGIRTPQPIAKMAEVLPDAYAQFLHNVELLETHFKDMQVRVRTWNIQKHTCAGWFSNYFVSSHFVDILGC